MDQTDLRLECLKLAQLGQAYPLGSISSVDDTDPVVARARAYYAFVSGSDQQPAKDEAAPADEG